MKTFRTQLFGLFTALIAALLTLNSTSAEAQVYKCISHASVTYQNTPCQVGEPVKRPTVDQLNAERKKKNAFPIETLADSQAMPNGLADQKNTSKGANSTGISSTPNMGQHFEKSTQPAKNFNCDSRKYCSQMTSCAEATFFLSHCPGVKMDGGKANGIPCEQQWCNR